MFISKEQILNEYSKESDSTEFYNSYYFGKKIPETQNRWMINISSFPQNDLFVLEKVIEFCLQNRISFQMIRNRKQFLNSFKKDYNPWFSGNLITLFIVEKNELQNILKSLNNILLNVNHPKLYIGEQYNKFSPLHFEYGSLHFRNDLHTFNKEVVENYYKNIFLSKRIKTIVWQWITKFIN
ncbi:hypothetical protein EI74_0541 [Mycoplasma testudineum]|uniref:RamC N-terminal domain-containing protein n=1 Tax=Mycoplasma testudineum TaxID=244584 RepID=A0A4R6ID29_9MOLU|nr:hypothetical protein [Mycoplasma testudineum]OYD26766.1 hypothetical protein CG473_02310 [Mycoplasma testudineum]TDO19902.1 hypothetical protein EI74_0541 [Mycoplasma testudineum]